MVETQLPPDRCWTVVSMAAPLEMQLKLASKGFVVPNAVFGESSGAISWDNVACTGSEATLQQCPRAPALPIPCERSTMASGGRCCLCCKLKV